MRFFYPLAATVAALVLSGCVASATIGAPATPPPPATPAPPPPPQVVIVQPPPATVEGLSASTATLVILVVLIGFAIAAGTGYAIARIHHMGRTPPAEPYSSGMYTLTLTPDEYREWAELQQFKARQIAQANREVIHVRR